MQRERIRVGQLGTVDNMRIVKEIRRMDVRRFWSRDIEIIHASTRWRWIPPDLRQGGGPGQAKRLRQCVRPQEADHLG